MDVRWSLALHALGLVVLVVGVDYVRSQDVSSSYLNHRCVDRNSDCARKRHLCQEMRHYMVKFCTRTCFCRSPNDPSTDIDEYDQRGGPWRDKTEESARAWGRLYRIDSGAAQSASFGVSTAATAFCSMLLSRLGH